jgi:hypothetical protein
MEKREIVEKLLEKNHITSKEAVTLLEKEVVGVPQQPLSPPPSYPQPPYSPGYPNTPMPSNIDIWYSTNTN